MPHRGDRRALIRVLDELLWRLRREGLAISTAQAVDVVRAVEAVGLENAAHVRIAVEAIVAHTPADRRRFGAAFDAFFAADRRTLQDRLRGRGFTDDEVDALGGILRALSGNVGAGSGDGAEALGLLAARGADLDRLLASIDVAEALDARSGPQLGYRTHRLLARAGLDRARRSLPALRVALTGAIGARGDALADAVAEELDRTDDELRAFVRRTYDARLADVDVDVASAGSRIDARPIASLDPAELDLVRLAVRRLAARLSGGARLRRRRARRGRLDPHRTLRRALATEGVPILPARTQRRRERPRIVLLCDVSDSVRAVAAVLLEFTYAAQELFDRARSFVFVSDLVETTALFEDEAPSTAIARTWGSGVARAGDDSNYGRVLRAFWGRHARELDRRTTVVVLGDGRTNFHDPAADVLDRIRERVRGLVWLATEPRSQWGQGDSAMALYAPKCSAVHVVERAADFDAAARTLVARSRTPGR